MTPYTSSVWWELSLSSLVSRLESCSLDVCRKVKTLEDTFSMRDRLSTDAIAPAARAAATAHG